MTCFPRPPFDDFPRDDAAFVPQTPEGLAALEVPGEELDIETPAQATWDRAHRLMTQMEAAEEVLARREARLTLRERTFWLGVCCYSAVLVILTVLIVSAGNRVLPKPITRTEQALSVER